MERRRLYACTQAGLLALAVLAWWLGRIDRSSNPAGGPKSVPVTDPGYWVTMLTAGVFGTVLGDWCQKAFGENLATAWLIVLLVVVLIFGTKKLKNLGSDLGGAVKGFKDGVKGGAEAGGDSASATTAQQVAAPAAKADGNTVDVEAKAKS